MCVCVCVRACMCVHALSCVKLFVTPWSVVCQFPLSMEFSRQNCWSGLPFPTADDLNSGTEPASLASPHWQENYLPVALVISCPEDVYFSVLNHKKRTIKRDLTPKRYI